jgi:acyl dehydratase
VSIQENAMSGHDNGASGFRITIGSFEEGCRWIGKESEPWIAEFAVNEAMIQYYCSAVEDSNPSYWDREFAQAQWGGIVAPPSMLMSWSLPLQWRPVGQRDFVFLAFAVPLPGGSPVNSSTETEFFQPMRVGDLVTYRDRLVAISDEKATRLGTGHFVTTVGECRNQHGELLARNTNVLFRFVPHGKQA